MYEKLVSYAAKQLELDAAEITPESTFESLGIDSLDIVEMIMDLESELGVELDLEISGSPPLVNWLSLSTPRSTDFNQISLLQRLACNKVALVGEIAVPCTCNPL